MAKNVASLTGSEDIMEKVGGSMPLPDTDAADRIVSAAEWLIGFGKSRYMFLNPEIALIEELLKQTDGSAQITIVLSSDLDEETRERIKNNIPGEDTVELLDEPHFPKGSFLPGNGLIVMSGYLGGCRAMVTEDTYRVADHYSEFLGKKVFVPYTEQSYSGRPAGWIETKQDMINEIWRYNYGYNE